MHILWYVLAPLAVLLAVVLAMPYKVLRESRRAAVRLDGTHSDRRADAERAARRRYYLGGAALPVVLATLLALLAASLTAPAPAADPELLDLDDAGGALQGRSAEQARLEQMLALGLGGPDEAALAAPDAGTGLPSGAWLPSGGLAPGVRPDGSLPGRAAEGLRQAEALLGRPLTNEERARLAALEQRYRAGENPADLARESGLQDELVREVAGAAVREWAGAAALRIGVPVGLGLLTLLLLLFALAQKKRFVEALRERRKGYYATDNRRLEAAG